MILGLTPHPDFPMAAIDAIEVEVLRAGEALSLTWRLTGRVADLVIPPPAAPARADELWRHTCFEAFLRTEPGEAYLELNFAPSGQWAAYRFDGYRAGMAPAEIAAPVIELAVSEGGLELRVTLELPDLGPDVRLAVTAVVEETPSVRSYWALAHPPGRPDFHHAAGFAARL